MPSTSKKQHNFMAMVAHNPKMAKKVGVSQSVGADFLAADKGKKFKTGGGPVFSKIKSFFKGKDDPKEEMKEAKAIKSGKITPTEYAKGEKMEKEMPVHRGKTKKFAAGGIPNRPAMPEQARGIPNRPAMPSQASPQAAIGMANRPAMPSQASPQAAIGMANRPAMKKGGKVKKFSGTAESAVKATPKPAPKPAPKPIDVGTSEDDDSAGQTQTIKKKKGGAVKCYAKGGGIESKGKTKGRFV